MALYEPKPVILLRMCLSFRGILLAFCFVALNSASSQTDSKRSIARCAEDGEAFGLPDAPDSMVIARISDISVRAGYVSGSEEHARFTFSRAGHMFREIAIDDLYNPNGWLPISPDRKAFAITWSNGGAAGGWNTRIFSVDSQGEIIEKPPLMLMVERDFSSRHNCRTRGDNYQAVRWMDNDHLLVAASVYGTSDCGKQMGYTEGYLINSSTDKIERRLTERQLLDMPMVCTWNNWQPH